MLGWAARNPNDTYLTSTPSKASTGRCLLERRRITSIVQETHFIRASRLQRGHTFEEQFEFVRNPGGHTRNNCKRIWSTSAIQPCDAQICFNHTGSQRAN